jgi:AcrR family transcriptional regulator
MRESTASRILEASRQLFNIKGYAATSLTEIAASIGISQGNQTYHFRTKLDIAMRLENDVLEQMRKRRETLQPGHIAEDYVEHLLFGMELTWNNRFLLRDRLQYAGESMGRRSDSELQADFSELQSLLARIGEEGMFTLEAAQRIEELSLSLWIVSRYWTDYLRELEGLEQITWHDQSRGIQQHFAILLPCLKATARTKFKAALEKASSNQR